MDEKDEWICDVCSGTGKVVWIDGVPKAMHDVKELDDVKECPNCNGKGFI